MRIKSKKIIGLPVYTESNQYLGVVKEIEIDPAVQAISGYTIAGSRLLNRLIVAELFIKPAQVISLTEEKMIVTDALSGNLSVLAKVSPAV